MKKHKSLISTEALKDVSETEKKRTYVSHEHGLGLREHAVDGR